MSEYMQPINPYEEIYVNETLSLKCLEPEDAQKLFELVDNNRPYLDKWLPWVKYNTTVEDSSEFIEDTIAQRQRGESYGYGFFFEGELIGHASLMHVKDNDDPEIGAWIAEEYSSKGITTNAIRALTELGLGKLNLDKIILKIEPENTGSNRVAEKLGYEYVNQQINDVDGLLVNIWETR